MTVPTEPLKRLHPLSPLLHGFKALAVIVAAISVQGAYRLGWRGFLGAVIVTTCLAVAASVVSWLVTGYHVVGRELRIQEGLIVRRNRAIPLERLQAVEVVRPLLARATGLAELRLEVVGGGKTEAPLAYLTVADAAALRQRLLDLSVRAGAPATPGPIGTGEGPDPAAAVDADDAATATDQPTAAPFTPATAPPPERPLHTVVNQHVWVGQLLTPQVIFLPIAVVLVALQYLLGNPALGFVAIASMFVAIIGVLQQPVRRVLSDWNFRLGRTDEALRIRHGLTETRSQTVPVRRVQAVGITWPLLWRGKQWLRSRLYVAGFGVEEAGSSDRWLPVGDLATAHRLVPEVLPGVDLTRLPLAPPPRRARWIAPLRQPILGAGLTDQVFATRDGRITRELVLVPYARIQSVRVVQGPLQRLLDLATVHADTAGPLSAAADARDLAEARQLAAELTRRAQAAREADQLEAARPGSPAELTQEPGPPRDVADASAADPSR